MQSISDGMNQRSSFTLLQDLGNYERFMNVKLSNDSNLTTGKVYQSVIEKERRGESPVAHTYFGDVWLDSWFDDSQVNTSARRSRWCPTSPMPSRSVPSSIA
jgi:hypothetical protein